jgi:predicted phosphodiesterase
MKMSVREILVISDIHGDSRYHKKCMETSPYTLQLGDCGFSYNYVKDFDPERHKIIGGNHDNYDEISECLNYVGDYGFLWDKVGFIRGAYSVDRQWRTPGEDWWSQEELSQVLMEDVLKWFVKEKPEIMVTHECPITAFKRLKPEENTFIMNRTATLLEDCFRAHKPKLWIFGHHHRSAEFDIYGTHFVALDVYKTYKLRLEYV